MNSFMTVDHVDQRLRNLYIAINSSDTNKLNICTDGHTNPDFTSVNLPPTTTLDSTKQIAQLYKSGAKSFLITLRRSLDELTAFLVQ